MADTEKVLRRFDATDLRRRFGTAGLLQAVERRGFTDLRVSIRSAATALPHVELHGSKAGRNLLLLEACLSEATVPASFFAERGFSVAGTTELAVAYWVREQDPSRPFTGRRPPLPLQEHPGLGVLPLAFRVIRDIAVDLGKDGVACVPKFYHDAYIFYRSRLFLFLDGREQGRFERLMSDLARVPLAHASWALVDRHVRDQRGGAVEWRPGFQVCPLSDQLTTYFNSGEYAALVDDGAAQDQYFCEEKDYLPALVASTESKLRQARKGRQTKE